jgi:hypothetical protein
VNVEPPSNNTLSPGASDALLTRETLLHALVADVPLFESLPVELT